jgi:hypothetical protein
MLGIDRQNAGRGKHEPGANPLAGDNERLKTPFLLPDITHVRRALPALAVRLIRQGVHSAGVDPAIVEVEQRAHRDRQVDGVIIPTGGIERLHIFFRDSRRVMIHFIDEPKQGLVLLIQSRAFEIPQYAPN